jgi:predicted amidohydrolase
MFKGSVMNDLVLKGGRVVDPSQALDKVTDIAFANGKVAAIGDNLSGKDLRDVKGKIVSPGLIDLHTHVYWGGTSLGVEAELLARTGGVTTFVDAGSAGPGNFHGFRKHVIEPSPVRILPYLNVAFPGIFAFSKTVMVGECSDMRLIDPREAVRVALALGRCREEAQLRVRAHGQALFVGEVSDGLGGSFEPDGAVFTLQTRRAGRLPQSVLSSRSWDAHLRRHQPGPPQHDR